MILMGCFLISPPVGEDSLGDVKVVLYLCQFHGSITKEHGYGGCSNSYLGH